MFPVILLSFKKIMLMATPRDIPTKPKSRARRMNLVLEWKFAKGPSWVQSWSAGLSHEKGWLRQGRVKSTMRGLWKERTNSIMGRRNQEKVILETSLAGLQPAETRLERPQRSLQKARAVGWQWEPTVMFKGAAVWQNCRQVLPWTRLGR